MKPSHSAKQELIEIKWRAALDQQAAVEPAQVRFPCRILLVIERQHAIAELASPLQKLGERLKPLPRPGRRSQHGSFGILIVDQRFEFVCLCGDQLIDPVDRYKVCFLQLLSKDVFGLRRKTSIGLAPQYLDTMTGLEKHSIRRYLESAGKQPLQGPN